jgi:tetratricopeptide (TPR) repeat protein
MMVTHLVRSLQKRVPTWDTPSRLAFFSGVILLLFMLILGFLGPEAVRIPARVGAFGLLLTLQLVILWGNRRLISPYHEAQHHFINGEYSLASDILEQIPLDDKISVDALILLGNTYRHLGQYDDSISVINRALELKPEYHFALYGMGKTLLVTGLYEDASNFITKALSQGAPDVVQFDIGYAYYLLGDYQRSSHHFTNILSLVEDEPSQLLFVQYCLYKMQVGDQPSNRLILNHLEYWRDEATKYRSTPYGMALQSDIDALTMGLKEN